jgi:hypothetical protein
MIIATIRKFIWLCALAVCFYAGSASAATFYLEPASGTIIKGCTKQIIVKMSLDGASSNGAQAYVDYTSLGGGTISIGGGGIFSTYGTPPGTPAGSLGLYGYGGIVSGNAKNFAVVNVRSNANGAFNLAIKYDAGEITSKIAANPTSENILTGVTNGSYAVIDGYCETNPPYLAELNPVADKPNHPVGQNILFDLRDDSSGLNMSTFNVTVQQNSVILPITVTQTAHGTDDKWYSIVIDPTSDLTPELKVVVTVSASDKAGNAMTRTYQFNDLTCAQLGCTASAVTPQCSDGVDNDADGFTDFPADTGCSSADDNNEYPSAISGCATSTPGGTAGILSQCSDGVDNDNDNLIDMADPGCENSADNNEFAFGDISCPTATTTPSTGGGGVFSLTSLRFFLGNRSVETAPNSANNVDVLQGGTFTVAADISSIDEQVSDVSLVLGQKTYQLFYDNQLKMYAVDILDLISTGNLTASLTVTYGENLQQTIPFSVAVLPRGTVIGRQTDGATAPLTNAIVNIEQLSGGKYILINSAQVDSNGRYGFVLPNGAYRLTALADDYRSEETSGFTVSNHIINRDFKLLTSVNLLDAEVPLSEKAAYVSEVAQEQIGKLLESANDPNVEAAARNAVAPIALGAAALATIPAFLLSLLSYLRFLFLQPIFLVGLRRRKKWGIVYNALTKMPIDLATVRLIDQKSGRIVQSRVTDQEGRYAFFVEPGLYRIEASKPGFIFPTKILQEFKEDTSFLDLYHGEPLHVDEKYAAISANIPLDPIGVAEKTPFRLKLNAWLREFQKFVASLSIAAGLLAVIISPTWWTIGLLILQVALFFLFKRLATPPKPKNWGIVYDRSDKKPINRAVARLFSKQFNKLVATEVTDSKGRYSFMVGPNEYFITFEKNGYQKSTSPGIKIKEKNEVVKIDMSMQKQGGVGAPPAIQPPNVQTPPAPPFEL